MRKMQVKLSEEEMNIIIKSLVEMRNDLLRQGRYTDAIDELLLRLL